MKTIIIFLAICCIGAYADLTDEQKTVLRGFKTDCLKKHPIDESLLEQAKNGVWTEPGMHFRCFFECMLKKIKIMNEDGTFNEEKAKKKIGYDLAADKVDGVIMKCKEMKGADICETAMKMMKCYAEEKALMNILKKK